MRNDTNYTLIRVLLCAAVAALFAVCEPFGGDIKANNIITVSFNAGGGIPAPVAQDMASGGKVTEPAAMTRAGYIFGGWYEEAVFANKWDFAANTVTGSITLYAKWIPITYTVVYDKNADDATGTMADSVHTYDVEKNLNANSFTRYGYTFDGWARASTGAKEFNDGVNVANLAAAAGATVRLYAKWVDSSTVWTVKFETNGGIAIGNVAVLRNTAVSRPAPDPTRVGYTFDNWFSNAGLTSVYNFTSIVTGDITLYAKWNPIAYTVVYDKNAADATGTMANSSHTYDIEKNLNPNAFTRAGYIFAGWAETSGGSVEFTDGESVINLTATAGTVTLYAKWGLFTYTVAYNKNADDATGTMENSIHTYNVEKSLNANAFTRAGYLFTGWAEIPTGTVEFTDGAVVINLTTVAEATVTLYAKWTVVYTVTFNADGGSPAPAQQTVDHGGKATEPQNVTRNGYTLAGWFRDNTAFQNQWNFATDAVTQNITLYAKWNINQYTVTFSNGGNTVTAQTIDYGSTAAEPQGVTQSGYTLAGWFRDNTAFQNQWNFATDTVTQNITLYAKWYYIEMVFVQGGTFQLGKDLGTAATGDVTPVSNVTLTGFYIGKYEVTQKQYQAVMGSLPSSLPSSGYGVGDNYPVYYVGWYDALVFCNKLSVMEGLTPAYRISNSTNPDSWGTVPTSSNATWNAVTIVSGSTGYRLPTEAQWEYAAKGGNPLAPEWVGYTYAGSDTLADVGGNNNGDFQAVGTKAPNGLGLYDLSGNVSEWCWDWYSSYTSEDKTDPTGASSGSYRVNRGGRWYDSAGDVRSAGRSGSSPPDNRGFRLGFRLARP